MPTSSKMKTLSLLRTQKNFPLIDKGLFIVPAMPIVEFLEGTKENELYPIILTTHSKQAISNEDDHFNRAINQITKDVISSLENNSGVKTLLKMKSWNFTDRRFWEQHLTQAMEQEVDAKVGGLKKYPLFSIYRNLSSTSTK